MKHVVQNTFLFLLNVFVFSECKFQVKLVQVLMRHGERTPSLDEIKMYPNDDRYNVSIYEPWGLGQLTNQGKYTVYEIGRILRRRYDKYLGPIYYPKDIYAFSTNVDRTKTSLHLMLAGLYPPSSVQMWNPDLAWFPIPTYYAPIETDNLLKFLVCPKFRETLKNVSVSQKIRDKITVLENVSSFLSKKTGTSQIDVGSIYQLFTAQKAMNLTMPIWYTDKVDRQLEKCFALLCEMQTYTTKLKRFTGGMIIKMFMDNLTNSTRKMYVYVGHDVNIGFFLRAHNITEPRINYGSTIMFETLRDESSKLYIRILLLNGPKKQIVTLKLANCDKICPLELYKNLIQDVLPSKAEINCPMKSTANAL